MYRSFSESKEVLQLHASYFVERKGRNLVVFSGRLERLTAKTLPVKATEPQYSQELVERRMSKTTMSFSP